MTGPIIVATDFSARADRAIDRALQLGAEWNARVILLHAVKQKAEEVDQAALDAAMESVLPHGMPGTEDVEFVYVEGEPPEAIAQAAEQFEARLIVLGPARYNSLGDYFLGTAVDHVLRHCRQPVLIVKQRPHRRYGTIVAPSDLSPPSAEALRLALDWFDEARLRVAHACHIPFDAWQRDADVKGDLLASETRRTSDFLDGLDLSAAERQRVTPTVVAGSVHDAVNGTVRECEADLVVIGSHGESGFRHATIGSKASALLETTRVDTLMVRMTDD